MDKEAMNGLPNHHASGYNGARLIPLAVGHHEIDYPAASAGYHGLGDIAMSNGHFGYGTAGAGAGMDLLLLQQLRSQDMMAGGGVFARRQEELNRIQDGHNRIVEAELANSAMRDRVMAQQQAQEE